jgi:hypothetical protein
MVRFALLLYVLVALTPVATGGQQLPGQWQNQFPGTHEQQCAEQASEIVRLNKLLREQHNKITLLEEKVKLLQAEVKKVK